MSKDNEDVDFGELDHSESKPEEQPWYKELGFDSPEEARNFIKESKAAPAPEAPIQRAPVDDRFSKYPYAPLPEDKEDEMHKYATTFFRNPSKEIIDLVAPILDRWVPDVVHQIVDGYFTNRDINADADFVKSHQKDIDALVKRGLSKKDAYDFVKERFSEGEPKKDARELDSDAPSTISNAVRHPAPTREDGPASLEEELTKELSKIFRRK